eukprot:IDg14719t1
MSTSSLASVRDWARAFISRHVGLSQSIRALGVSGWVLQFLVSQIIGLHSLAPVYVPFEVHGGTPPINFV